MFWILLVKDNGYWFMDCGDYDKETITYAYLQYKPTYGKKNLRIVSNDSDNPEEIKAILDHYNRTF